LSSSTAIRLVGLDFGSTTTSGVLARASVRGSPDRPSELTDVTIEYRSSPIFTPFEGDTIDERRLGEWLDDWSHSAGTAEKEIAGGGAIVTGLAARTSNALVVRQLVQARFGQALIATADDPALESWLAFMANCRALSLGEADASFLNFDIGGGTTNIALGRGGTVRAVGCYQFGARHVRFQPGTYRIVGLSHAGRMLFGDLNIARREGDTLDHSERTKLLDFLVGAFEALAEGRTNEVIGPAQTHLVDVLFDAVAESPVITFSGGVGELVYRKALGEPLPGTTAYGDLGIDLAQAICQSPSLSRSLTSHTPTALGRATMLGLVIHHVELSGTTLYLPDRTLLPMAELPIVARVTSQGKDEEIAAALRLAARSHKGGCIGIELSDGSYRTVRSLGARLAAAVEAGGFPLDRPLVLLVNQNVGKALGHYATHWGRLAIRLIVLDELPDRGAAFVTLGKSHGQVVPVSFYGF
jgi:ethanolamine utilization protein EutA